MKTSRRLLGWLHDDFVGDRPSGYLWRAMTALIVTAAPKLVNFFIVIGILAIYFVGRHIPIPGTSSEAIAYLSEFGEHQTFSVYDLFTGGNLQRMSVFALGIIPFITASFYVQVAAFLWRVLAKRQTRWSSRVTGVVTLLLCAWQASEIAPLLQRESEIPGGLQLVYQPGWTFVVTTVLALTAGTACLMWICDAITRRGIADGMLLVFVVAVIAGLRAQADIVRTQPFPALLWVALSIGAVALIARGHRRTFEAVREQRVPLGEAGAVATVARAH